MARYFRCMASTGIQIFQVNIGKMCNQTCKHCHVDAGPDRKEIMAREIMQQCIDVLNKNPQLKIIDITGGAPELNPNFRWFVDEIRNGEGQTNFFGTNYRNFYQLFSNNFILTTTIFR